MHCDGPRYRLLPLSINIGARVKTVVRFPATYFTHIIVFVFVFSRTFLFLLRVKEVPHTISIAPNRCLVPAHVHDPWFEGSSRPLVFVCLHWNDTNRASRIDERSGGLPCALEKIPPFYALPQGRRHYRPNARSRCGFPKKSLFSRAVSLYLLLSFFFRSLSFFTERVMMIRFLSPRLSASLRFFFISSFCLQLLLFFTLPCLHAVDHEGCFHLESRNQPFCMRDCFFLIPFLFFTLSLSLFPSSLLLCFLPS